MRTCACMRACVRVRTCVRASCVRACLLVRARAHVYVYLLHVTLERRNRQSGARLRETLRLRAMKCIEIAPALRYYGCIIQRCSSNPDTERRCATLARARATTAKIFHRSDDISPANRDAIVTRQTFSYGYGCHTKTHAHTHILPLEFAGCKSLLRSKRNIQRLKYNLNKCLSPGDNLVHR